MSGGQFITCMRFVLYNCMQFLKTPIITIGNSTLDFLDAVTFVCGCACFRFIIRAMRGQ